MDDSSLVYLHQIKLEAFCSNFLGARTYPVKYFESRILYQVLVEEICLALEKAHPYLFNLYNCRYGLALRSQMVPLVHPRLSIFYPLNATLCLLGEEECKAHVEHCMLECELKPFRWQAVPLPYCLQTTSSPSKPLPVEDSSTATRVSHPTMIRTPQAPKEPTFSAPTKKQVAVLIPPHISAPAAPLMHKADLSSVSEAEPASDEEDDAASVEVIGLNVQEVEHNEIEVPLVKKPRLTSIVKASLPPPCHLSNAHLFFLPRDRLPKPKAAMPTSPPVISPPKQVHPLRSKQSPPHSSKGHCKAKSSPVPSEGLSCVTPSPSPMQTSSPVAKVNLHALEGDDKALSFMAADNVDNIIYVQAFHPQVDLQFHEPPLHQALEYMKLSMLPPAPDSLTKYALFL
ncbi:hypothetical protein EDD85DRAFT_960256 [Armillaria nabsnona]|nr:hypothetical protein EDD85DRAFT_960256 [Armillaria nabsnona]